MRYTELANDRYLEGSVELDSDLSGNRHPAAGQTNDDRFSIMKVIEVLSEPQASICPILEHDFRFIQAGRRDQGRKSLNPLDRSEVFLPCQSWSSARRMTNVNNPNRHEAHDQLLARVNLALRRVLRLADEIEADHHFRESEFAERVADLERRCRDRTDVIRRWTEVEVGAQTAVEDLGAAVDALEADLAAARATEPSDYEEAIDRQIRSWRTRIDRLRLQGALASMESRDELEQLAHRLEDTRTAVLADLQDLVGDAKQTVIDLRNDSETVLVDVRKTVEHAAAKLAGKEVS